MAQEVASKAEGVFLWAVLVCDSLCSGLLAEDDEQTLLQRLQAYPKGLDDLFDRMFANLEEVHYQSLAFYFNAARKFRFTVALAVASRPTQRIESLEHFGAMCEREVTRVMQQSKGLLQVTPKYFDDGDYTFAWSLKDVRTGCPSPFYLWRSDFRLAKHHLGSKIEFVHRSAYDYIFGHTSADRLVWLKFLHEDEMIRNVLTGALWLVQYGPILHMTAIGRKLITTTRLEFILPNPFPADGVLEADAADQNWFCNELEELADSLHSWTSAAQDGSQLIQQLTEQTAKLGAEEYFPQDLRLPLREFWYDILQVNAHFVATRSRQLWDREDTYLNVAALFDSWVYERFQNFDYRRSFDSAMFSVATEYLRRRASNKKVSLPTIGRRHYAMMFKYRLSQQEGELISWEALSTCHEAAYVLVLHRTAKQIAVDRDEHDLYRDTASGSSVDNLMQPSECEKSVDIGILEAFCSLIQSWQLYLITPKYVQGIPLPLQLSVPMLWKCPPTSRYLNRVETERLLACRTEKRLRLSCFARRGPGKLRPAEEEPIPVSPIASYRLCLATTSALLMFSNDDDTEVDAARFVGSTAEMSDCLELVTNDIWDDAENQLTAWEKLYLRACVRLFFRHFWRSRAPSVGIS
jgi:hypothetical protein